MQQSWVSFNTTVSLIISVANSCSQQTLPPQQCSITCHTRPIYTTTTMLLLTQAHSRRIPAKRTTHPIISLNKYKKSVPVMTASDWAKQGITQQRAKHLPSQVLDCLCMSFTNDNQRESRWSTEEWAAVMSMVKKTPPQKFKYLYARNSSTDFLSRRPIQSTSTHTHVKSALQRTNTAAWALDYLGRVFIVCRAYSNDCYETHIEQDQRLQAIYIVIALIVWGSIRL